ncbi:hypothetical protein BN873_490061 [Candidatus Competibacter denitrificans Run_A_D11]|uniref:Uncharacterized protein n=1 Tax=Candidatus Competibacter denitrificans Run_A_D11 TaxID=1400863 RepID=W6M6Y7_9GAMM|nr:hypothetical protein BN873_490061 [Candidatus Competibacter denitrificans Run_A_D11]
MAIVLPEVIALLKVSLIPVRETAEYPLLHSMGAWPAPMHEHLPELQHELGGLLPEERNAESIEAEKEDKSDEEYENCDAIAEKDFVVHGWLL